MASSYDHRKSEEYLRTENIIGEDEQYLTSFPLGKTLSISGRSKVWFVMAFFAFIFLLSGFVCLFISYMSKDGITAICPGTVITTLAILIIVFCIFNMQKASKSVHYFLTSKGVYFSRNLNKPYKRINIADLQEVIIYIQAYYDSEKIAYMLGFMADICSPEIIETTVRFIETSQFHEIFPKPELIKKEVLPKSYLTKSSN